MCEANAVSAENSSSPTQAAAARGSWAAEFGRDAPLHVELGPGNGFFMAGMSSRYPDRNWLAIELRFKRVMLTARKVKAAGSADWTRITRFDANALHDLFEPGEIDALYVNHPDPWPKDRWAKNRLLGGPFLDMVAELMKPGAQLRIKTDHVLNVQGVLHNVVGRPFDLLGRSDDIAADGVPWGDDLITNYQSKFNRKGEPVYALWLGRQ